jgi:hypothetical protein
MCFRLTSIRGYCDDRELRHGTGSGNQREDPQERKGTLRIEIAVVKSEPVIVVGDGDVSAYCLASL